ncbi:peptide/nickel transport system permease protein [Rhizobium azooxidifex]|uniref:Peptide/nickel transport system permease protein n=1 Tax=Mycoplana azooxidifex TaxID=1636188 RepID=A0A7W6DBG4_9HYPH|nr:ABC transporter permease [Mycoplana azooxidifex]MBB3980153.1 peptide/nickel transport system permease protein [Mycoplana azooxidifex]
MNIADFQDFARRFAESRSAVISLAVSVLFIVCAVFAPLLAPTDPYDLTQLQLSDALKPTGSKRMLPGEEVRANIRVDGGTASVQPASPTPTRLSIVASPCGPNCLAVGVEPPDAKLASLQVRNLPAGATVEGGRKHPIQPWWTLDNPDSNQARITSAGPLPAGLTLLAIAKSLEQETGFVFRLGTDNFGRDMLSAILYGIRISVYVGLVAAGAAMVLGTALGLLAAWRGGVADAVIMRAVDFMLGLPALLVGLAILAILGNGVSKVVLAVVIVQWSYYARTARSFAISELGKEYVEAARCLRLSPVRIMLRHVLPNCMPQIIVLFTLNIAAAISMESSLSFLGVGLPLTRPSLGMLIASGYEFIFSQKYWISIYPGIVLLVMIVAMNLLGDRLRDLNNPRLDR